jgi:hypothetical protein
MEPRKIKLTKIPLEAFINALEQVWESGANFIDIIAIPNVEQDVIGIAVRDDYKEIIDEDNYENENLPNVKKIIKLTDKDISKLLEE